MQVHVDDPGIYNNDSGPDFLDASFTLDGMQWIGLVEIHIKSSDWFKHRHQNDPNYDLVLLHVVYENDRPVFRSDKTPIPTIELKGRISYSTEIRFNGFDPFADIVCQFHIHSIEPITLKKSIEENARQRLKKRVDSLHQELKSLEGDWEELVFRRIVRAFGFKLNEKGFKHIAHSISVRDLRKVAQSKFQIEALLLGIAGFLESSRKDSSLNTLSTEFAFMKQKLGRELNIAHPVIWNLKRSRPTSSPIVRIAQLSSLLAERKSLFAGVRNIRSIKEANHFLSSSNSENGCTCNSSKVGSDQSLGKESIRHLIINVVVPVQAGWKAYIGSNGMEPIELLEGLSPESNRIVSRWKACHIVPSNAMESQGLIELYNQLCCHKACLSCRIGHEVFNR